MFPKIDATFEDGFHMDLCNKRSTPAPPSVLAAGTPTIRGSLTTGAKTNSIIAVSPSVSRYIHRVHTHVRSTAACYIWLVGAMFLSVRELANKQGKETSLLSLPFQETVQRRSI